jgi:D-serine deaminase-like pyridoxal phosphate-dependent protein
MVALGHCTLADCGYVVRATVISRAIPGQIVIDAGSKALSKEPFRAGGHGYGIVAGRPDHVVSALSEEHGTIELTDDGWRPGIGDTVDIIPNHVCLSVNLQDGLWVDDGEELKRWSLPGRSRGRLADRDEDE